MKPDYDFSAGERGKFFRPNASIQVPVYLENEVQEFLAQHAARKGVPLEQVVNELLKHEIQLLEADR